MKKKLIIYFVLIITIMNLSSLVAIVYQRWKISSLPYSELPSEAMFKRIKREVALTPEQIEKFQELHILFRAGLDSLSAKIAQKNKQLGEEIKKSKPDSLRVDQIVKDISEIQTKTQYQVIRHLYSIKRILTPQQQEKFFNIVLERLSKRKDFCTTRGKR